MMRPKLLRFSVKNQVAGAEQEMVPVILLEMEQVPAEEQAQVMPVIKQELAKMAMVQNGRLDLMVF